MGKNSRIPGRRVGFRYEQGPWDPQRALLGFPSEIRVGAPEYERPPGVVFCGTISQFQGYSGGGKRYELTDDITCIECKHVVYDPDGLEGMR